MQFILTSNFPVTPVAAVTSLLKRKAAEPRIAWIPPHTEGSAEAFVRAQSDFAGLGFHSVECLDIDEECDPVQLAYLHEFDVVFLSDGDPVRFRFNALRSGLAGRVRQSATSGSVIVGDGGGALLLTPNVSVMRLEGEPLDQVLANRARFDALGAFPFEVLPGVNRRSPAVLQAVCEYSRHVEHDVLTLADGGAILHGGHGLPHLHGSVTRYRKGTIIEA